MYDRLAKTGRDTAVVSEKLTKLNFFAKVDQKGTPTLEIRNIRFDVDKAYDPLQNVRRSYSGYPMFDWAPVKDAVSYRV